MSHRFCLRKNHDLPLPNPWESGWERWHRLTRCHPLTSPVQFNSLCWPAPHGCPAGQHQRETSEKMGNHQEQSGQAQGQACQLSRNTCWHPKPRQTSQWGLGSRLQVLQRWDSFVSLKPTFMVTATPEKSQVTPKPQQLHHPAHTHCIALGREWVGEKRRCREGFSQKGTFKKTTTDGAWREHKPTNAQRQEGDSPALPQPRCPFAIPVIDMAMHRWWVPEQKYPTRLGERVWYWPGLETGLEVVGSIISTKREKEKKKREHLGVNHTWKTNTEWDSKQSCNRHDNFI